MQGDSNKTGSQTDVDVYMTPVKRTSNTLAVLSCESSESSFDLTFLQGFMPKSCMMNIPVNTDI